MTDKQILEAIDRDIYEDAYERQKVRLDRFRGENLAENIETALYLCPGCRRIGTIKSKGDRFFCDCGLEGAYTETGLLEGESLPFSTITEWGIWQDEQLAVIIGINEGGPICSDEHQQLFEVQAAVGKTPAGEGRMYIDHEVFHCAGRDFPLEQISRIAIVGQMTLLFGTLDGAEYEVQSPVPRCALKYREAFRILTGKS